MTTMTQQEVQRHYLYHARKDNVLIGHTPKAASTLVQQMSKGIRRVGIVEAAAHEGPVVLIVRHPLDRLVSNYEFWRRVNRDAVPPDVAARDRPVLGDMDTSLEEWWEVSERNPNAHWVDQTVLHSYDGRLVPNTVYPWEVLPTTRAAPVNVTPGRREWASYYTEEFRARMEERYKDDLALYNAARTSWDGTCPKYF